MEEQTLARGQCTIANLYDGKTTQISLSSSHPTTQFFSRVTKRYTPDYTESNIIITPELYFSNDTENQAKCITGVSWTINSLPPAEFGATAMQTYPFSLTIARNIENVNQLYVDCMCVVADPDTMQKTVSSAHICFTKKEELVITPVMLMDYPKGNVFKDGKFSVLTATTKLMCGAIDVTSFAKFTWYVAKDGKFVRIIDTPETLGQDTNTLQVAKSTIKDKSQFKCVADYQGTSYVDYATFSVFEDPYWIKVESRNGDSIHNGEGTVLCEAHVYQGNKIIPDEEAERLFEFNWTKHKRATGQIDKNWNKHIGRCLELTYADIERLSTFICEIVRKNDSFPYVLPLNLS